MYYTFKQLEKQACDLDFDDEQGFEVIMKQFSELNQLAKKLCGIEETSDSLIAEDIANSGYILLVANKPYKFGIRMPDAWEIWKTSRFPDFGEYTRVLDILEIQYKILTPIKGY